MQGYCVKCRKKQEMENTREVSFGKGRRALKGSCPKCGTGMFRILPPAGGGAKKTAPKKAKKAKGKKRK